MEIRQYNRLLHLAKLDYEQFDYLLHCAIGISEHEGEGYIFDQRTGQTISQRVSEMEEWCLISKDTVRVLTELRDFAEKQLNNPEDLRRQIDLMRLPGQPVALSHAK